MALNKWGGNAAEVLVVIDLTTLQAKAVASQSITSKLFSVPTGGTALVPLTGSAVVTDVITDGAGAIPVFYTADTVTDVYIDRGPGLSRLKLISASGGGSGTIRTVNQDPGPDVSVSLYELPDVHIPVQILDSLDSHVITPGPQQGDTLLYDTATGTYRSGQIDFAAASAKYYDNKYAPKGYEPPWFTPVLVLGSGQAEADFPTFPTDGLVFDETILSGIGRPAPSDAGFVSESLDIAAASITTTMIPGKMVFTFVPVRDDRVITRAVMYQIGNGAGGTINNSGMAIFNAADLSLLATTTTIQDASGTATTFYVGGAPKYGVFSALSLARGQNILVGLWYDATGNTTQPTFRAGQSTNGAANIRPQSSSFRRSGNFGTGMTNAASVPGSITSPADDSILYAAIY